MFRNGQIFLNRVAYIPPGCFRERGDRHTGHGSHVLPVFSMTPYFYCNRTVLSAYICVCVLRFFPLDFFFFFC